MSDTPRTDDECSRRLEHARHLVPADFARILERELNERNAELLQYRESAIGRGITAVTISGYFKKPKTNQPDP